MARFTETVNIRPAGQVPTQQNPLISALESFSAQQISQGVQQVAAQSLAEGQAAYVDGQAPQFKEESFFGGISSKAYNEGLRAQYVASLDRDNREEVARITKENESDLVGFNDAIENYRKATLNNVDPTARQVVSDSLDSLISANRVKVQTNEITRRHKENATEVEAQINAATSDAQGFARDGNMQASAESALAAFAGVDSAVEAGFITPAQGAEQKRDIEKGLVEENKLGGLFRTFDSEGEQAAYQELDELSKKRPKGFSPEEWDSFIAESQTALNRKASRLQQDAVASARQIQLMQDYEAIRLRIEGDDAQIINPKAADKYYQERVLPSIEGLPPEAREAATAQYIDRLKLVPATVNAQVTNAVNSDNPDLMAEAVSLIDRIDEIPGIVNKIPKQQQAYLDSVVSMAQNMSPSEAIELSRKGTDPKDKARIESVEGVLKEELKDDPDMYLDKSRSAFSGPLLFDDPNVNELAAHKMAKEYQSIYEGFRKAGSSESDSFKKADKFIRRSWGVSQVLGRKEVMKFPPEDYYSINGDADWIKPQLMQDLKGAIAGFNIDDVYLMSNDRTARGAEIGQPSYAVKILSDGVFYNIDDNWLPDKQAEIDKRKNENITEAMSRRQKQLSRDVNSSILYDRQSKGLF